MRRALYTFALFALTPVALLHLWWRARRQPEYLQNVGERFGRYRDQSRAPVIWLHAVSVGETRASEPLVRVLQQRYPQYSFVITHTTPTGRATSAQIFGDSVLSVYLPYDLPFAVDRFLSHFDPQLGLLMETELWPNLILACERLSIPLFLVNARLSERSARGYERIATLIKESLQSLSGIAAQTLADAQRLEEIGAPGVIVTGNMKFDIEAPLTMLERGKALRESIGTDRPVLLAASTREGEERIVLDALSRIRIDRLLCILVPRHPQRFDEVAKLLDANGIRYARKSRGDAITADVSVLLGDSMGEMFMYYAACDVAFVGGSLLPLGGQNLIEACAVGKPVLVGPHTFNFAEATELAVAAGAAIRVHDAASLANTAETLFNDKAAMRRAGDAAHAFADQHRGATERVMQLVESKWSRLR